jgi:hypothetical protein
MHRMVRLDYTALYSTHSYLQPQCADLTEADIRLRKRIKYTTLKANEPEYTYHAPILQEPVPETRRHITNPQHLKHTCEECAPLPSGHPDRSHTSWFDASRRSRRRARNKATALHTTIDWSKLTEQDGKITIKR